MIDTNDSWCKAQDPNTSSNLKRKLLKLWEITTMVSARSFWSLGIHEALGSLRRLDTLGNLGTLGDLGTLEDFGTLANLGTLVSLGTLGNF